MARNTGATLISYTETAWNTGATPNKTVTIPSVAIGDIVVVIAGDENNTFTPGVPTASGMSFTSQKTNAAAGTCSDRVSTAPVTSGGTNVVVTVTSGNGVDHWGFGVWVWRGSDGVGASAEQHTTTHTVSLTPTDTHSSFMVAVFDFSAAAVANSITPTVTNSRQAAADGTHYTVFVGDIVDQASGAATSFGLNAGGTTGVLSIVVMEILGTTSGGALQQSLQLTGVGA